MAKMLKRSILAAFTATLMAGPALAGPITVYSALEEDEIADYLAVAKTALPDVQINVLRLSTGDLGARLIAEAANPQADVVWGMALTNMLDPAIKAQLDVYPVKGAAGLPSANKGADNTWVAPTGYVGALCVNTELLKSKNLPMPTSWADLANPVYKGEVVMPSPASSGTGYLQVAAILQGMGAEKGWTFLKSLDANIAQYTTSGSKPCKMARAGEFAIGASLSFVAMKSVEEGFPVKMVIPADYAGYELEASGLVKGSKHAADSKRFLDWTLSADAAKVYGKYKELAPLPGAGRPAAADAAGLPADVTKVLFPVDFIKSAASRGETLKTWKATINR